MEPLSGAKTVVAGRVHCKDSPPLLQVGLTNNRLCLFLDTLQRRQQYRHQQHDNGNHRQKLYQRKSFSFAHNAAAFLVRLSLIVSKVSHPLWPVLQMNAAGFSPATGGVEAAMPL